PPAHAPRPPREAAPRPPRPSTPAAPDPEQTLAWVVLPKVQAALDAADQALAAPPLDAPEAERDRLRRARVQLDRAWERLLPLPSAEEAELEAARQARREALTARVAALPDPRRAEEQAAAARRLAMLAELQALATDPDLRVAIDRARAMQVEWRALGRIPRDAPADLGARWREAMDAVFARRDAERGQRLQRLEGLVQQAETLTRSADPQRAADAVKALQQRWKDVGGVRGPEGDALWARFRAAADAVFEARRAAADQDRDRAIAARRALIDEARARAAAEDAGDPEDLVADLHRRWKRLGPAPRGPGDALWAEFREACDRLRHPPQADPALLGQDPGALRHAPFAALATAAPAPAAPPAPPDEASPSPSASEDPTDLVLPAGLRR
ncbi:DUF349 domain-containing protein, partial [Myxococcota bacterium]|nr:DUF349 domain-containing protein [Myxococcota bacterium]